MVLVLYSGRFNKAGFYNFCPSAITTNYMIVILIYISLTMIVIPLLCIEMAMCKGGLPLRSVGRVRKLPQS